MTDPRLWLVAIVLAMIVIGAGISPLFVERAPRSPWMRRGRHRAPKRTVADDPEADELMRMGW